MCYPLESLCNSFYPVCVIILFHPLRFFSFFTVSFQLPHSFLNPIAFWGWAETAVLEGARKLETLCRSVEDTLNAPVVQVGADGSEVVTQLVSLCCCSAGLCVYV